MDVVVVFVSQFVFVLLRGMQQINVVAGRKKMAAATSLGLGVTGLAVLDILTNSFVKESHWSVYVSYLVSGVAGILAAMWIEEWSRKRRS